VEARVRNDMCVVLTGECVWAHLVTFERSICADRLSSSLAPCVYKRIVVPNRFRDLDGSIFIASTGALIFTVLAASI